MNVGDTQWQEILIRAAARLGVAVDAAQAARMGRMAETLLEWNRRVNLTAITEPREVALKHFVDSLAAANQLPAKARILDVGTGAGFPGLPLKILRPDLRLTLIDGVRKKISFVAHAIRLLGLDRAEALHVRLEDLARQASPPAFDVVVCRAVADLARWVPAAAVLLAGGGCILAYKGPQVAEETAAMASAHDGQSDLLSVGGRLMRISVHPYHLPFTGDRRTLVRLENSLPRS